MDKKGLISFNMVYWIGRFAFLLILVLVVGYVVSRYQSAELKTRLSESEAFFNAVYYSPDAISYFDVEKGISVPGIIDLENFNEERIESALNYEKNDVIAASFSLFDLNGKLIKTVVYNKEKYDLWKPISKPEGKGGIGATSVFEKEIYVLYFNGKTNPGILKAEIILPRR